MRISVVILWWLIKPESLKNAPTRLVYNSWIPKKVIALSSD